MLLTLAVDWRSSVVRDEEADCFCEVAGVSIVAASGQSTHFRKQPSGLNVLLSKHALCIHAETTSTPMLHNILILPNVVRMLVTEHSNGDFPHSFRP